MPYPLFFGRRLDGARGHEPTGISGATGTTAWGDQGPVVMMPMGHLRLPAAEEVLPIREADWVRIRSRVSRISDPRPILNNLAWTFFGIAISAALGYFPWLAAYDALVPDAQRRYFWVSVVMISVGIVAVVIAMVCGIASRLLRKSVGIDAASVCEDMDAVYRPPEIRARCRPAPSSPDSDYGGG